MRTTAFLVFIADVLLAAKNALQMALPNGCSKSFMKYSKASKTPYSCGSISDTFSCDRQVCACASIRVIERSARELNEDSEGSL